MCQWASVPLGTAAAAAPDWHDKVHAVGKEKGEHWNWIWIGSVHRESQIQSDTGKLAYHVHLALLRRQCMLHWSTCVYLCRKGGCTNVCSLTGRCHTCCPLCLLTRFVFPATLIGAIIAGPLWLLWPRLSLVRSYCRRKSYKMCTVPQAVRCGASAPSAAVAVVVVVVVVPPRLHCTDCRWSSINFHTAVPQPQSVCSACLVFLADNAFLVLCTPERSIVLCALSTVRLCMYSNRH